MPTTAPSIQPDDGSIMTPDITPEALAPEPAPTGTEPNVGKLASLLGEGADARHVALVGLFVLAVLYTLHLAQAFILPVVLAVLLDFMLSPLVRALKKRRVPEPAGAGLIIVGLLGVLVAGGWYLAEPAADWIARAPESAAAVQRKLQSMRGSVEQVTKAAEQVEKATNVASSDGARQVEIKGPGLSKQLFGGTASFLSSATVVLFLTYFLLPVATSSCRNWWPSFPSSRTNGRRWPSPGKPRRRSPCISSPASSSTSGSAWSPRSRCGWSAC